MQIKGFYYKSKSGNVSSLNTSNIDVPDVITSGQLAQALETKADTESLNTVEERVTALEESYTSEGLSEKVQALEGFKTNTTETLGNITADIVEVKSKNTQQDAKLDAVLPKTADITALFERLRVLETQMNDIRHADVEVAEIPEEAVTDNKGVTSKTVSSENEVKVENVTTDTDKLIVSAKAIEVHGLTQANNTTVLTSKGDVTITDVQNSGTLARTVSNAQLSVQSPEYVRVSDCTFGCDGHNILEIGLNASTIPPKSVIIDNCDFTKVNNNAILVFGMQEGGVVTVSNCHFGHVSDCVRYSNRLNVKNVTFNFVNCVCDHWDTEPAWAGFMIFQDYTSGSKEKEEENNLFSPDKVKVNFINCTGPYGKIDTEHYGTDQSKYCGCAFDTELENASEKQLVYVWNSYGNTVNYDENRYPTVVLA